MASKNDTTKPTSVLPSDSEPNLNQEEFIQFPFEARPKGSLILRLLRFASPEYGHLMIALLAFIVSMVINLALPSELGSVLDSGKDSAGFSIASMILGDDASLSRRLVTLVLLFVFGSLCTFFKGWLFSLAGERLVARLRKRLFSSMISLDATFFDMNRTGELINRLSSDATLVQKAATTEVSMVFRFAVQVIGGLALMLMISWKLALMLLVPIPILGLLGSVNGKFVRKLQNRIQNALASSADVAEESISGITFVKSFNCEVLRYDSRILFYPLLLIWEFYFH